MNTLYWARIERRDFGNLHSLSGLERMNVFAAPDYTSWQQVPDVNALIAVWANNPSKVPQLPHLLICREGTEVDWTAWISTFAAKVRPFSAYTRLISHAQLSNVLREPREPSFGRLLWSVAGVVLGEVLAASRLPVNALETLPASAFESTLSFSIFRAAATYEAFGNWPKLIDDWGLVRQLTKQPVRDMKSRDIARVCAIILDAGGFQAGSEFFETGDERVKRACRELLERPSHTPLEFAIFPEFRLSDFRMNESRELRVIVAEKFVRFVMTTPSVLGELASIMLGWLVSRIAPGTIQHLSLLEPALQMYPTSALWYGFCAGLGGGESGKEGEGARQLVDLPSSAKRVVRELLREDAKLGPPNCDIGLLELVALSKTNSNPLDGIITTTQGTAIVELAPFVSTTINASLKPVKLNEPVRSSQREQKILEAMGGQIERLRETFSELVRDREQGKAEETSLFTSRRKKKG